jgi:hypothetical protein
MRWSGSAGGPRQACQDLLLKDMDDIPLWSETYQKATFQDVVLAMSQFMAHDTSLSASQEY